MGLTLDDGAGGRRPATRFEALLFLVWSPVIALVIAVAAAVCFAVLVLGALDSLVFGPEE